MTPSTTVHRPQRLYGRSGELAVLDAMVNRLAAGTGGTLVLTAPPGLGRSALVRHTLDRHGGGPVLHTTAAPAERLLPYSGVHALLCSARFPLPVPPADVLRSGIAPVVLFDLLAGLGARRPLLVCVDDAHAWDPDSRTALAFAVRRLAAGARVAVLLTVADHRDGAEAFAGLPALRLAPLDAAASAGLLDRLTGSLIDAAVREELRHEGVGNPRLLTALVARLTDSQLTGRHPLPRPPTGGEDLLDAYAAPLAALSDDTRTLLLLAAAAEEHEPEGAGADAVLLLRAGRAAGIDLGPLAPAEAAGVVRSGAGRVHFTHPLVRRAVLRRSPPARRRAVHRLLAAALDAPHESLPRLIQRACAADGCDPALAGELAAAAVPPRPHADRAAALTRAAGLSADESLRAARFAAAAELAWLAGEPGRARVLLARVRAVPAPGRAHYVRGLLALRDGPVADAREALLTAASLLAPYDESRTVSALLGAAEAAWAMGDAPACLDAMRRIPVSRSDPALERYRAGICAVLDGRPETGRALLRGCAEHAGADTGSGSPGFGSAGEALRSAGISARTGTRPGPGDPARLLRAGIAALVLGEVDTACRAGARALAAVRARGPDALLPQALEHLAYGELRAGRHASARAHAREGLAAAGRLGQRNAAAHLHAILALAASVEGDARTCAEHADAALADAGPHGLTQAATLAGWAVGRAELADGRSAQAAARLAPLVRPGPRRGHFAALMPAVPCFVEAAVLAGRGAEAYAVVEEFAAWTARTADPQTPAQLARCRALLAPPAEVAARYEEALAHHERAGGDFERARTQLLYGHWLRRRRRTREARGPLRDALVGFERSGARLWSGRVRGELRAAGEAVPGERGAASPGPLVLLTPQQQRIARCVAEGATNREVALRLSLSTRTVDHHLRNVFATLGVRSRTELARLLDPRLLDREDRGAGDRYGLSRDL
ncbi:LuxR C-terminal-related transcriptional regulator [Streptomyces sp. NPDC088400]|uniref:helix-turn-helix transcriptional regulator n=1 Tax=Streptomyces sp. NPDC088400 TaxID=3365861 RepID=UPI00382D7CAE